MSGVLADKVVSLKGGPGPAEMGDQNLVKLPLGFDGKGLVISKKKIRNLEFFLPSKEVLVTGSVKAASEDSIISRGKAD